MSDLLKTILENYNEGYEIASNGGRKTSFPDKTAMFAYVLGVLNHDIEKGFCTIEDYYPNGTENWYLWKGFLRDYSAFEKKDMNLDTFLIGRAISLSLR